MKISIAPIFVLCSPVSTDTSFSLVQWSQQESQLVPIEEHNKTHLHVRWFLHFPTEQLFQGLGRLFPERTANADFMLTEYK